MPPRPIQWVNTPVLAEAIERYQQGRLPRSMHLWIEQLLELEGAGAPARLGPGGQLSPGPQPGWRPRPRIRRQAIAAP